MLRSSRTSVASRISRLATREAVKMAIEKV